MSNRILIFLVGSCLTLALTAGPIAASPMPIVEFAFNDAGSTTASSGSNTLTGNMLDAASAAADLHSAGGGGVGGQSGDLAFDNSASTGMGSLGTGGRVEFGTLSSELNGTSAITITGWYRTAEAAPTGDSATLVNLGSNSKNGVIVRFHSSKRSLSAQIGDGSSSVNITTDDNTYSEAQQWIFFAFTYDSGVTGQDNFKLYKGTVSGAVQLVKGSEETRGNITITASNSSIGNLTGNNRPFDGLLDNIRVYGVGLSASELETLRVGDVPEPASVTLILVGSLLAMGGRHRR